VLHLAGGIAFGVDVGDLFELEGSFEGDGVVDASAEEGSRARRENWERDLYSPPKLNSLEVLGFAKSGFLGRNYAES
jgi:hypothetical protein